MPRQRKGEPGASLRRWFKEEWVDISKKGKNGKHPPCGRENAKTGETSEGGKRSYPKCRPKNKVSSATPRTAGSLSKNEKAKLSAEKKKIKGEKSKYRLTKKGTKIRGKE
jgi:hypothetical protein